MSRPAVNAKCWKRAEDVGTPTIILVPRKKDPNLGLMPTSTSTPRAGCWEVIPGSTDYSLVRYHPNVSYPFTYASQTRQPTKFYPA